MLLLLFPQKLYDMVDLNWGPFWVLTFKSVEVMFVEQEVLTILEFNKIFRFFGGFGFFSNWFFGFDSDLIFDTRFWGLFLNRRTFGNWVWVAFFILNLLFRGLRFRVFDVEFDIMGFGSSRIPLEDILILFRLLNSGSFFIKVVVANFVFFWTGVKWKTASIVVVWMRNLFQVVRLAKLDFLIHWEGLPLANDLGRNLILTHAWILVFELELFLFNESPVNSNQVAVVFSWIAPFRSYLACFFILDIFRRIFFSACWLKTHVQESCEKGSKGFNFNFWTFRQNSIPLYLSCLLLYECPLWS